MYDNTILLNGCDFLGLFFKIYNLTVLMKAHDDD